VVAKGVHAIHVSAQKVIFVDAVLRNKIK